MMIGTALALEKQKTCCDCKKQDAESSFPKQKNRKGLYTYMTRCAPCLAIFRASYRIKAEKSLYKTCRDCKKQDLYENFPKQKGHSGNYYALPRCSECHAKARVEYRKENFVHIASQQKMWRQQTPDWNQRRKMQRFYSDARKRGLVVSLTEEKVSTLFHTVCDYCGELNGLNGIDRVDNSKGYIEGNVVACCSPCNFMKHVAPVDAFLDRVEKIYKHVSATKERS